MPQGRVASAVVERKSPTVRGLSTHSTMNFACSGAMSREERTEFADQESRNFELLENSRCILDVYHCILYYIQR